MASNCRSCAMPLGEESRGAAAEYCRYCSDETGALEPHAEVQHGIARWFMSWQRDLDEATAPARAAHSMQAMPAWAAD